MLYLLYTAYLLANMFVDFIPCCAYNTTYFIELDIEAIPEDPQSKEEHRE